MALRSALSWGVAMLGLVGCSGNTLDSTENPLNCQPGQTKCAGSDFKTCSSEGNFAVKTTCRSDMLCDDTLGCITCAPNTKLCANNNTEVRTCAADGTIGELTASCAFGQTCSAGACVDSCELAASEFIYLVDTAKNFLSFEPRSDTDPKSLKVIGKLNCPAGGSTPNSMGVDRHARAWVAYQSGEIFWVNPKDASCQKSGYTANQLGFETFGMGFSSDAVNSRTESLFLGDGPSNDDRGLGRVDPNTLMLSFVARFPSTVGSTPEMTGTGAGELYGYFPSTSSTQHIIARINKTTAKFELTYTLPGLPSSADGWAFAHWGGRFYQFVTNGGKNQIRRYDPTTKLNVLVQDKTNYQVVGAGVSTCAPYTPG